MKKNQQYLIALGGNQPSEAGRPTQTLQAAVALIAQSKVEIKAVSRFFQTPCFPPGSGPDYVNAAARIDYAGGPGEVLAVLHRIEAHFGRERVERWGRRTLDLDLLAAGSAVLPDAGTFARWRDLPPGQQVSETPDQLILPHPRLQERSFVLVPLADIAPDWVHPVLEQSVLQMLAALPEEDKSQVIPL